MLVDYVKTTYICSTQQLNDNSLPLIPTPPLIMAVNIGAAECRPLPSDPPWNHYLVHNVNFEQDTSTSSRIINLDLCLTPWSDSPGCHIRYAGVSSGGLGSV